MCRFTFYLISYEIVKMLTNGHGQNILTRQGHLLSSFNDVVSDRSVLNKADGLHKMQCASWCLRQNDCYSFFYHKTSKRCHLHSTVLNFYTSSATPSDGYRYYLFSEVVSRGCPAWATRKNYIFDPLVGLCYALYTSKRDNFDARQQCADDGGHLLVVPDITVNNWLGNLMTAHPAAKTAYIDGNDEQIELDFKSYKNQSWSFTNWAISEPNSLYGVENCVAVHRDKSYQWVDIDCAVLSAFVCQIDV